MTKVRRAIIPVARLDTRFVPVTKALPKEMLPIVDNLTSQYIVNEVILSSVADIIIETKEDNDAIEAAPKLERNLFEGIKFRIFNKEYLSQVEVHYSYQKEPKRLRHTIGCTCKFIVNDFYAELLEADTLQAETPKIRQLLSGYEATLSSVSMDRAVNHHRVRHYGIANSSSTSGYGCKVDTFIKKLVSSKNLSNLVTMSCHMLKMKIMNFTGGKEVETGGEIQFTLAMQKLNEAQHIFAYDSKGEHYDTGEKLGCIKTIFEFKFKNNELRQLIVDCLTQILNKESAWAK
ncbi:sugar phosphate nucleotidyltransferase [Priestia sp. YIM B13486]|uniref:sugar phosphate nucleotidyltransferase n=1 Tax=Priestia sp. YIM B13486 TaxID=3366304 RepID=UPI00366AC39F